MHNRIARAVTLSQHRSRAFPNPEGHRSRRNSAVASAARLTKWLAQGLATARARGQLGHAPGWVHIPHEPRRPRAPSSRKVHVDYVALGVFSGTTVALYPRPSPLKSPWLLFMVTVRC